MTLFLRPQAKIVLAALVLTAGGSGAIAFRKSLPPISSDAEPPVISSASLPLASRSPLANNPEFEMAPAAGKTGQSFPLPEVIQNIPPLPSRDDSSPQKKRERVTVKKAAPVSQEVAAKISPAMSAGEVSKEASDIADASLFQIEVKRPVLPRAPAEPVLEKAFTAPPTPPTPPPKLAQAAKPRSVLKSLPPITESTAVPNAKVADPVPPLHRLVPIYKISKIPLPPLPEETQGTAAGPRQKMYPLKTLPVAEE